MRKLVSWFFQLSGLIILGYALWRWEPTAGIMWGGGFLVLLGVLVGSSTPEK